MARPKRILIANRGTAAMRIMRCCEKLDIDFVTVFALDDRDSLHVTAESVCLHEESSKAADTYMNWEALFRVCEEKGCDALHPGYGFLSENAEFAAECERRDITFIGPTPEQISAFGFKHSARSLAETYGVPLLPGSPLLTDVEHARSEAKRIGYPVLLKCIAGGGGIGMKECNNETDLIKAFDSVKRLGNSAFGNDGLFLEKFLPKARHVEVQIFGDGRGNVVALGERDCSTQRRNQKVIEESPAPFLREDVRNALSLAAKRLAQGVQYRSAGTVEFIVDVETQEFYFLEVNTRIQVEHGVTEQAFSENGVTDLDLMEWMILTAGGELDLSSPSSWPSKQHYHSIQCRIYAEDANKQFQPAAGGILTEATFPAASDDVRVETWVRKGTHVSELFDPLLAKLIVRGRTREEALGRMREALRQTHLAGIETNVEFLEQAIDSPQFRGFKDGQVHTHWLQAFDFQPRTIDVIEPGTQTSVQDYPGRVGYWAPGVPPSGPMDHLAFRVANKLVGNDEGCAALEFTLIGATLRFNSACYVALTGAEMQTDLNGKEIPFWRAIPIKRGDVLRMGAIKAAGARAYLAVSGGGLDVPLYLGSRSTFVLGKFGGHAGRVLIGGDVLHMFRDSDLTRFPALGLEIGVVQPPTYSSSWEITVLLGPHAAPDFFQSSFIDGELFDAEWTVHYNSNRMGIRLSGPKPDFARLDGGEAGLHPSNIHDTVYAIGTVNFTGDMPVILGMDGPSLGGFVCPITIVKADLWKMGQLGPGDKVKFKLTDFESALREEMRLDTWIGQQEYASKPWAPAYTVVGSTAVRAILKEFTIRQGTSDEVKVVYRLAGDKNILVEYGELVLDIRLRCRVQAFFDFHGKHPIGGVIELSPGVRSFQVHFDSRLIVLDRLLNALLDIEQSLDAVEGMVIPSRIIRIPLAFEASSTFKAIEKYRQSVRDKAPWLPSNTEFIRRINGLESTSQVRENIFNSNFLVLGLGDVYLGAPCAVPLDPRHRLMTTKYNPARTWTEEGEVGIGGVFMCIYGAASAGGYQLVGRTVPIWNRYPRASDPAFTSNWLLHSFDQVSFYPVSEKELMALRARLAKGEPCTDAVQIIQTQFVVKDYLGFLAENATSIADFQQRQRVAFETERDSWSKDDEYVAKAAEEAAHLADHRSANGHKFAMDEIPIRSQVAGNVWSIPGKQGDRVEAGQTVAVIEAMKLEIAVSAPIAGEIHTLYVSPGIKCMQGDVLLTIRKARSEPEIELPDDIGPSSLRVLYFEKGVSVRQAGRKLLKRIHAHAQAKTIFISLIAETDLLAECARLDALSDAAKRALPLFGTFAAIKDNIDCLGFPTTCACPDFTYSPKADAFVVSQLRDAGAIVLGKTNLDQFATGLVGARSPYGACTSVFNSEYISGGSSSGSAVAVAANLASFSLGTDTAGSGRVPAMMNGLVGLKPSRGRISCRGVVPACQSLDCVSIFAKTVEDAVKVFKVADVYDAEDPYSRRISIPQCVHPDSQFVFAVPDKLEFFRDDAGGSAAFAAAIARFQATGGKPRPIDMTLFYEAASLLYSGPFVAERLEALEPFIRKSPGSLHPVTLAITMQGETKSAVSLFRALHLLESLKRKTRALLQDACFLLVPTAPRHYKLADVLKDPIQLNSNLGVYTNFVNLLDMCGLALPLTDETVPRSSDGMPYSVTVIADAGCDSHISEIGARFLNEFRPVDVVVVGAHLSGMPLNYQLTARGATFVRKAVTAKGKYRLFALSHLKPGLVRVPESELVPEDEVQHIEVEVWRLPSQSAFGSFVVEITPPLALGTVELERHESRQAGMDWVRGFVCEAYAARSARDITRFGGWRAFKRDASMA